MTIEILEPDVEAIIQRRIDSGEFESPGEVVAQVLRSSEQVPAREFSHAKSVEECFEKANRLGVELDMNRYPATDRSVQPERNADQDPEDVNGLDAMFAKIRGLADDIDFSRIPSTERPIDL